MHPGYICSGRIWLARCGYLRNASRYVLVWEILFGGDVVVHFLFGAELLAGLVESTAGAVTRLILVPNILLFFLSTYCSFFTHHII